MSVCMSLSVGNLKNQIFMKHLQKLQQLGGLCGVCGDDYSADQSDKHNEAGGKYAQGIIVESYPIGTRSIHASVELTAYHIGHFEFRLCPHNDPSTPVSQDCLNE